MARTGPEGGYDHRDRTTQSLPGTYGYRRLHAQLVRWGEQAGPELVRALAELGLVACQPGPGR